MSTTTRAAVLTNVVPGTPAGKAGLQTGVAFIAVDGRPIDGSLSLVDRVRQHAVVDRVTLK